MTTICLSEARRGTDCHASDVGHWFAMTALPEVSPPEVYRENSAGGRGSQFFSRRRRAAFMSSPPP